MASAKRLIDVRHSCRSRSRIAEMSVPAWPIPIHQTKLMMSKPQPTGMRTPQTPMPLKSRKATATSRSCRTPKEIAKPTNQASGVFRWRTMLEILSVTVPKSWPGPTIGSLTLATRDLRVRVPDLAEVRGARPRVDLGQERVVRRPRLPAADRALRVVDVAEDDGLGRADLLAGGLDLPFLDRPVLVLGVDAGAVDALDAVRALLHDPAAAHGDVGVARHLEGLGRPVLIEEKVEAPDLVGAVVRAVAGAHAPVVDHVVEPLVAVDGGGHGAHDLAGGVLALHAGHGLAQDLDRLRAFGLAGVVAVDADPLHDPAARDLVLAHDRDVVLGLAGHDAGVAADAGREVDRHPPGVALVLVAGVERRRFRVLVREHVGVLRELGHRGRAGQVAAFHAPVVLGAGERHLLARNAGREPAAVPQGVGRPERVGVRAEARAHPSRARAAIAEVQRDAVVGKAGQDPG